MHAAKARKRMEGEPPEYPPDVDYSAPVESWTFRDYRIGRTHKLVLFHSRRRRDSFRVLVNGTTKPTYSRDEKPKRSKQGTSGRLERRAR